MVQQRYAVVHVFERNEVEIIDTKYIITDDNYDRSDMNGEDWDAGQEVQVPWPLTKGKNQKHYVARVLRFGADIGELTPYRKAAEEGKDVPLTGEVSYGRGQRGKQPKRVWQSESEQSESDESDLVIASRQLNKKKKTTRKAVNEDARDDLRAKLDHAGKSEVDDLRREVASLREENQALRNALKIVNGLPGLLKQMEDLTGRGKQNQAKDRPVTPIPRPITPIPRPVTQLPRPVLPDTPLRNPLVPEAPATPTASRAVYRSPAQRQPDSPVPVVSTPSHGQLRRVFGYDVSENGKVGLGYGVLANAHNLQFVSKCEPRKTTYMVCEVLFSRDEMANSSLTGKKSNAFKDAVEKPKLNQSKVSAVIDFVRRLHPTCDENTIRKLIGIKINIVQKLSKKKGVETPVQGDQRAETDN